MKKIISCVFVLALACAAPILAQTITLTASPNPMPAGTNVVTVTWNAPGHSQCDVHLTSPTGQTFASGGSSGSQATGAWAQPGVTFYLVDHNTLAVLASLTLTSQATITLSPNPLPSGVTSVTVTWSAASAGYTAVDVHTGSATGPLFQSNVAANGSATANSVTPGEGFYLVDHVSSTFLASVSILGSWNIPVANQSACLPFGVLSQPATAGPPGYVTCWRVGYFHWFDIGTWTTTFTFSNPTSGDMPLQVSFADKSGNAYTPPSITVNGTAITLGANATDTRILPNHGVLHYVVTNSGAEAQGQIFVQVLAKDGMSLNTIQAVEDYSLKLNGVTYSTVTVPMSWVDQATTTYSSVFQENPTAPTGSIFGAFALKDMSGNGQTVDVKVFDVLGNQLGDKSLTLTANQTAGIVIDTWFPAGTFNNLPDVPFVRIQFTSTSNAPIAVLLLQGNGNAFSSVPPQPVLAQ